MVEIARRVLDNARNILITRATPAIAEKRSHLFAVPPATLLLFWEDVSNMNHYFYTAENPAEGATFTYHLAQPAQKVRLIVTGSSGRNFPANGRIQPSCTTMSAKG